MSSSDQPLDLLLDAALQIDDPEQRMAWMSHVCRDDPAKLAELISLVEASAKDSLIDEPLIEVQRAQRWIEPVEGLQLGPFLLLEPIGVGGMGAVYLARQRRPVERLVAVKLIQLEVESQQILQRFQSEQQILANMNHPNIAQILDAGASDSGYMYIAMEYVQGEQILDYCKRYQLATRSRIELMMQCCLAIQHAHQKGTIHRDIKPTNVMVTQVDGKPVVKVIDFGIAKALGSVGVSESALQANYSHPMVSDGLTHFGTSLGTPPYMSPEQYSVTSEEIDTRSDIYSLGALMYALLTDSPPFAASDIEGLTYRELKEFIANRDPTPPSQQVPQGAKLLRGDLDAIVLKAMNRDINQRYESVGLLIEDLRSYLAGDPVRANPETPWSGVMRFAKRHKLLLAAGSLALAGLLIGLVVSRVQEQRAIASEQNARQQTYASDMLLASMAIARGDYALSEEILERHRFPTRGVPRERSDPESSRLDWRLLASQIPAEPKLLARFPTKIYFGLDLPDRDEIAAGCKDSHLRFLDRSSGRIRLDIDTKQKEINGLALSPDGQTIASGGDDGTVHFYNVVSGELKTRVQISQASIFQVAWTSDGARFVTVGDEANARVWSLPDFNEIHTLDSVGEALECLAVNRQGQVAFGSDKGLIRIATFPLDQSLDIQTVAASMSRIFQVNRCSSITFSSSGRLLGVGLDNGYLLLMVRTNDSYQIVERIRFPTTVTSVAFRSDESKLALGENNGSVHVLELPDAWPTRSRLRLTKYFQDNNLQRLSETNPPNPWSLVRRTEPPNVVEQIPLDTSEVYLEFHAPPTDVIFSDNYVREWMDESGQTRTGWSEMPEAVIFQQEGVTLRFTNRYSGWADFKSLESQGRLTSWSNHSKRVASVVWDEASNQIQSFSEDGSIKTSPIDSARIRTLGGQDVIGIQPLQGGRLVLFRSDYAPSFLRFHPDDDSPIRMESQLRNQETAAGLFSRGDSIFYVAKSDAKDDRASARLIEQWDMTSGVVRQMAELPESSLPRYLVGVANDNHAVMVYEDNTSAEAVIPDRYGLLCWDLEQDQLLWRLQPDTQKPRLPRFSPRGTYTSYVKEHGRRTIFLVDTTSGREQPLADFLDVDVLAVDFSKDDRFIAISLSDNSIHCFRTDDGSKAWQIKVTGSPARDLAWSRDGTTLACIGQDGFLRTFNTQLQRMTAEIGLASKNPAGLKLSADEEWLYVLDRDGSLTRIPCSDHHTSLKP